MRSYCIHILTQSNITTDYLKTTITTELTSLKKDTKVSFENGKLSSLGMVVHTYMVAASTWEVKAKRIRNSGHLWTT